MPVGQLTIGGRKFMVIEESEYARLLASSTGNKAVTDRELPPLPEPDARGNVPAMEYARASLARRLIIERKSRGWSQTELARRAGVRVETINRLEKARNTADRATVRRIENALSARRTRSAG